MNKNRKKLLLYILTICTIVAVGYVLYTKQKTTTIVFDNGAMFHVVIADTEPKREQGLSGVTRLSQNEGMVFVFDMSGTYYFWMKDMLIPLDFVWIDENRQVVDITANVSPDSFPKFFSAESPVRYVLEIPAGSVEQFGIQRGSMITFQKR